MGSRASTSAATARSANGYAYSSRHEEAGALLHSLARNHALADVNEPLALAATLAFRGMNGIRLTLTNDQA